MMTGKADRAATNGSDGEFITESFDRERGYRLIGFKGCTVMENVAICGRVIKADVSFRGLQTEDRNCRYKWVLIICPSSKDKRLKSVNQIGRRRKGAGISGIGSTSGRKRIRRIGVRGRWRVIS